MNCKPGDMAKMIHCDIPAAIGLIVEVLFLTSESNHPPSYGPVWDCTAISGAKSDRGYCMPGEWCLIPDAWLRPIRPDGHDKEVSEVTELSQPKSHTNPEKEC